MARPSWEVRLKRICPVFMAFWCSTLKPGGDTGQEKGQTRGRDLSERPCREMMKKAGEKVSSSRLSLALQLPANKMEV